MYTSYCKLFHVLFRDNDLRPSQKLYSKKYEQEEYQLSSGALLDYAICYKSRAIQPFNYNS